MESLLPPLFPEPLDATELPEPRGWTCEHCEQPMNLWDWGHQTWGSQTSELPASVITRVRALCSACLVELALINHAHYGESAFLVDYMQRWHHQMWFRVGEPPGTLIAWQVGLPDRAGRSNPDGSPVSYEACIYAVLVDWWNDEWPQLRYPWSAAADSSHLVVLGARVLARPDTQGRNTQCSWIFRWLWPNPAWPEACLLDPPSADLTDDDAVRLNRARGAFYAFAERRGLKRGAKIAWPQDQATWQEAGRQAEAAFVTRHRRHPTDGELAAEMGVPKATFDRRKRDWGPPTDEE
jgi:hypothetical protein